MDIFQTYPTQGCPISSDLSINAAELLAMNIRSNQGNYLTSSEKMIRQYIY